MKKRFSILRVIGLFLLILAVFVTGSLVINLHSYVMATPKITPYENVTITTGQTVTISDLALIERGLGAKIVGVWWEGGSVGGIDMSDDNQSFTITDGEGTLFAEILAQGDKGGEDAREAVEIICK